MLHDQDLVSIQEVRSKVEKAYAAWQKYRTFTQEQINAVVEAAAAAGRANAERLAYMAVEETGMGNAQDKLAKNLLCSDLLNRAMRGMKTVGLLREIRDQGMVEYGVPVGVIAAIVPTTNPTSTVIYKTLISLKAGNGIVISPHPRAPRCSCETAEVLRRAAVEAGAPEDLIQCLGSPTVEATQVLMKHEHIAVILATGGHGMVRAAYSSGKPAFGVGPGNVPVLLDKSADLADALDKVVIGKSFDYGTVCSSEQTLVAEQSLRDQVIALLKARKAFVANDAQKAALAKVLLTPNWTINPKCVGQSPTKVAEIAGFQVPPDTSIIVAEIEGIGKQHPLSVEKLSPVLSLLFAKDFAACMDMCEAVLRFGGLGHTCVIYAKDDARIREFAARMPAMRVLVNTAAPQGSVGITTNVLPSMTLGCGAAAGNITSDNVGALHLINIKRLAYAVRTPEEALVVPKLSGDAPPARQEQAGGLLSQQTIAAAVEKYLAERGISAGKSAPAAPAVTSSVIANVAEQVVDRFLATRSTAAAKVPVACSISSCPCVAKAQPEAETPPAPKEEIKIVDFVSEGDVREAMAQRRKIYIGPRTIVTPSARDLGERENILVLSQRE
jgi:acyl-CoA reductase-like NAD-dependent aldehyde dehydrogenase